MADMSMFSNKMTKDPDGVTRISPPQVLTILFVIVLGLLPIVIAFWSQITGFFKMDQTKSVLAFAGITFGSSLLIALVLLTLYYDFSSLAKVRLTIGQTVTSVARLLVAIAASYAYAYLFKTVILDLADTVPMIIGVCVTIMMLFLMLLAGPYILPNAIKSWKAVHLWNELESSLIIFRHLKHWKDDEGYTRHEVVGTARARLAKGKASISIEDIYQSNVKANNWITSDHAMRDYSYCKYMITGFEDIMDTLETADERIKSKDLSEQVPDSKLESMSKNEANEDNAESDCSQSGLM